MPPGQSLTSEGGKRWVNAGPLSFRGTTLTYKRQVLQRMPCRTEAQMPTAELAEQCPPLIAFYSVLPLSPPSPSVTSSTHLQALFLGLPLLKNQTKTLSFFV